MDEFNYEQKETISVFNHSENEMEPRIGSPADGWEVVESSPGSPVPEARADVAALEEAVASAGSSGRFLQGDYFGCKLNQDKNEVLPVSTVLADKRSKVDGHSSEGSDAVVSLDSDTDAIDICITHNECIRHGGSMGNTDHLSNNVDMHSNNTTSHDDMPFYRNLMLNDEHGQGDVDVDDCDKMLDEFIMNDNELVQQVDRWRMEDKTYLEGVMHTKEDNLSHTHDSSDSCEAVESALVTNILEDGCALASGLEVLNSMTMSSPEMIDRELIVEHPLSEDSSSTALVEEPDSVGSSHGIQAQDLVNVQDGTISSYNGRPHKGFLCVSWVWSQFIRWQTQLGHVNTIWSVALAAAVMGILVLGRGWQRLQAQNQSLRSQLWAKEKRITQLMFQLMQTKDSLSKVRRVPVICVKPSLQISQDNF